MAARRWLPTGGCALASSRRIRHAIADARFPTPNFPTDDPGLRRGPSPLLRRRPLVGLFDRQRRGRSGRAGSSIDSPGRVARASRWGARGASRAVDSDAPPRPCGRGAAFLGPTGRSRRHARRGHGFRPPRSAQARPGSALAPHAAAAVSSAFCRGPRSCAGGQRHTGSRAARHRASPMPRIEPMPHGGCFAMEWTQSATLCPMRRRPPPR